MPIVIPDLRNYFKIELLLAHSRSTLQQLFKTRYALFYPGKTWDDTQASGKDYLTNVLMVHKKMQLSPVIKASVSNGNSNDWDITTLLAILLYDERSTTLDQQQTQQLNEEDKLLKQLRELRNKITYYSSKSINDVEFNQLWSDLTTILVALGEVDTELDKLKDDSIFDPCTYS